MSDGTILWSYTYADNAKMAYDLLARSPDTIERSKESKKSS